MKKLTLVLSLLAATTPALAAEDTADPGLEAMQAIAFFEGNWEGDGWTRRGPTEPQEFRSSERVESRLGGRVLIVEGMRYFQEIACEALSEEYEVIPASSATEARARLAEGGIDLMVLDLTLDGEDGGIKLLRGLSSKPCPILIFAAQDESEMYGDAWDELRKFGADDMVLKGMNVGESLARKVGALLGKPWDEES